VLTVRDLVVQYGRIVAVRGLTLEVGAGELVALVGPNGAGKSSTLAAVTGMVRRASGAIELDGIEIGKENPEQIVRRGVALVPEGRRIFGSLSVAENLVMGATTRRPGPDVAADVEEQLERFPPLRRYYRRPAGKLSGGEQQMLAIARGLMSRPRVLLLDEPSLGLAPLMVEEVFRVISTLRDTGVSILLVEQNALRAVEMADRGYVLTGGRVAATGTSEDLLQSTDLAALYLGATPAP
jgi:branched-chain amino acid transport system ATP-binding protein